jgi:tetratricopeptide (TPR) repeat protein
MANAQDLAEDATLVPDDDTTADPHRPASAREITRGTVVGRYVVLGRIGAGGMGTVYAAYDPQLDRKVAVKVLGSARASDTVGRQRMLREAQAMARLTHPNVVAVHDSGEHEGSTFIAMEYVQGRTIKAWLAEAPRPWRDVLRIYCAAGRGLEAAHAAGLVHRDFKPDNVMLADDGRVLVMDFGLARADVDRTVDGRGTTDRQPVVTETAGVIGTPAYMAPEQFGGVGVAATTDQFSFCVALYEGLWGERPFTGDTVSAIAAAVTLGSLQQPGRSAIPGRIRQAVLRGLANAPSSRHASMTDLLEILERDPSRWRRSALAIGLTGAAVVGSFAIVKFVDPSMRRCESGASAIDEVWSSERRDRLAAAFVATEVPGAADRWAEIEPVVDARASAWRGEFVEACAATHVRGEQSDMRLDLRMRCLADRRTRIEALLDELEAVDAPLVTRAASAAHGLPEPATCSDVDAADFVGKYREPALDPVVLERAAEQLAIAKARNDAGRYLQGIAAADEALAALGEVQAPALRGEALVVRGQLQQRATQPANAEATLREALEVVGPAGIRDLEARAWIELVFVVGAELSRPDEALAYELPARLAIAGAKNDPHLTRKLEGVLGTVCTHAGHNERALAHHEAAVALLDGASPHASVVVYSNYGNALFASGRYAEAHEAHRRAYDLSLAQYGPSHPFVATDAVNLGRDLEQLGDVEGARALYQAALEVRRTTLGPEAVGTAELMVNLANLEYGQLNLVRARELAEGALAVFEESLGPDHTHVAIAHNALGNIAHATGQLARAVEHSRHVERIYSAKLGADHPKVAIALTNRANVLFDLGDHRGAIEAYDRAIAIELEKLGADHPSLAYEYVGKAEALVELGRAAEAVPLVERAIALREGEPIENGEVSLAYFVLAKALWASSDAAEVRERALAMGRRALVTWRASKQDDSARTEKIERWLRERGGDVSWTE